tara:strand:- start:1672 stop:2682 length:1011 start_codon:yes stop_codon:yes gene_type:complete
MRLIFLFLLSLFVFTINVKAESRFGDLTELKDDRMRGKENQWVRPHPGPFVWNNIEKEKGIFSWDKADEYVTYAQNQNQNTIATIWPYSNWEQKSCKRKKGRSPFGKRFAKYLSKPCSMENYKIFLSALVDRYDGDGINDMPGLTKPIVYWEVMNEPEFKMFFKGTEDEFVEIFNFSSKLIKSKQKDAVIIMAGAAGMFPESKRFWKSALPKIKDHFDIANMHHITPPDGKCDRDFWVGEFSELLQSLNIDKPIWVTEAMVGVCKVIPTYINTFASGAEVIIDVGVNAPGMKMSKSSRKKLNNFIKEVDGFKDIKLISKKKAEFTFNNGTKKIIDF